MSFYDLVWYCNAGDQATTGYYAVAKRPQNAAVAAGQLCRQFTAPAVGSERVFVCIVAGTTANVADATWVLTRGAKTTDGGVTWMEVTGMASVNGDSSTTNTPFWIAFISPSQGAIIKRGNGVSYQICTTAGNGGSGAEPAFSDTAGVTTTDNAAVWTSLGPVANFSAKGAAPHARLANVFGSGYYALNNTVFVADNHAESQATAISISPNVSNSYVTTKIICHNHSGNYPPSAATDVATGATISTTGTAAITVTAFGQLYLNGLTFAVGVGSSSGSNINLTATNALLSCDNCTFKIANTSAFNSSIALSGVVFWNNCQVSFGAPGTSGQYIDIGNTEFTWQNTGLVLATGSSVPTGLLGEFSAGRSGRVLLEALDLSQITNLFGGGNAQYSIGNWTVKDCKLNAAVTIIGLSNSGQTIQLTRCDSGATGYKSARYNYEGIETTETSITRVGGAVDPSGQAQSRKIVTTGSVAGFFPVTWLRPYKAEPYSIWNATTGSSVTVTVYGTVNAGTLPNNDEIWIEVEYLGSSATPLGAIVNTTKSNLLAANAAVAADGSTWNGGGSGAGWSPFKLVATLSVGMPGIIEARVRAGKPSTTYYIDPKPDVTGAAVSSSHVVADGSIASEVAGVAAAQRSLIFGRGAPY